MSSPSSSSLSLSVAGRATCISPLPAAGSNVLGFRLPFDAACFVTRRMPGVNENHPSEGAILLKVLAATIAALALAAPAAAARSSDRQVSGLVSRGITILNHEKTAGIAHDLTLVKTLLAATSAQTQSARQGKALAVQGFAYAVKLANAQLQSASDLDAGNYDKASADLNVPAEWDSWRALVKRAQTMLKLKVRLTK